MSKHYVLSEDLSSVSNGTPINIPKGTIICLEEIYDTSTTKEGLWSDEDMVEFANQYHWSSTRITLDKFKASKQSQSNTPKEELLDLANPNPKYSFSPSYQPKEEQPSKEKDWEIVSYKSEGRLYSKNFMGEYVCKEIIADTHKLILHPEDKKEIHSVRRLSDNEVFSVGDDVATGLLTQKIEKFEIHPGGMFLCVNMTKDVSYKLNEVKKSPSTEPSEQPTKGIIEDEQCLSVNDVYSFLCSYYDLKYNIPNHDILIGIAKQKLSSIKNKQQ